MVSTPEVVTRFWGRGEAPVKREGAFFPNALLKRIKKGSEKDKSFAFGEVLVWQKRSQKHFGFHSKSGNSLLGSRRSARKREGAIVGQNALKMHRK